MKESGAQPLDGPGVSCPEGLQKRGQAERAEDRRSTVSAERPLRPCCGSAACEMGDSATPRAQFLVPFGSSSVACPRLAVYDKMGKIVLHDIQDKFKRPQEEAKRERSGWTFHLCSDQELPSEPGQGGSLVCKQLCNGFIAASVSPSFPPSLARFSHSG